MGTTSNLRLLDMVGPTRELDLASELFHRINRIIPANQTLLTFPPDRRVRDAIAQMRTHRYSQVPVVDEGVVLGVFSFRSFAQEAASATLHEWAQQRSAPGDLRVDEFLEQFAFARVREEMTSVFDSMDRDGAVLIGTPEQLIGILTPMDFLRYLYQVAGPFVLVLEIEVALRALLRSALNPAQILEAAKRSLSGAYGGEDKVPTSLEEMTFDNYQSLVSHGATWPSLESLLGGNRNRASGKLKEVGAIRNDLFHFKREITIRDHETLASHRNWLLSKVTQMEVHRKTEISS